MGAWKKVTLPILLLFLSLLLDGAIALFFNEQLSVSFGVMTPRLFVLVVIVLAFYLQPRHMYTLTIIFGFLYDSYFSGILGIYIATLTLIAYFVVQLRKVFEPAYLITVLMSVIMLTFLEFFVFGIYRVIDLTVLTTQDFMASTLLASLIFNTAAAVLLMLPLNRIGKTLKPRQKSDKSKSSIAYR
ncbi:Rod shape-determining protein MreD [Alkalibacterium sp. AK22]|uniref:rod shape-determining protein MreD n=1 Tax=Alkalibacterium sp. AK22 TaxID=1229520 RepID=UPI00044F4E3A|nr:rod shape-determining protein MreD [Alkalibacterium sp. AK22]EXJ22824.1 Rod shape-determining protein MreD [Alkalibacterium sp. AK22]